MFGWLQCFFKGCDWQGTKEGHLTKYICMRCGETWKAFNLMQALDEAERLSKQYKDHVCKAKENGMDKREGLTLVQAWQALLEGHTVCGKSEVRFAVKDGSLVNPDTGTIYTIVYPSGNDSPFRIVEPSPPPSLTFEEAAAICMKGGTVKTHTPFEVDKDPTIGQIVGILIHDLAERRGWRMEAGES